MLRLASKQKQETNQLTFAEIAEEKKRLADQQAELDRQLASAKDAEFAKVTAAVEDFNAAFGEEIIWSDALGAEIMPATVGMPA